jgi:uncharacterized protein
MRIVVDTNVAISAIIKRNSVPNMVFQLAWHHHTLLKSSETEEELRRILQREKLAKLITPSTSAWIDAVLSTSETVAISQNVAACRDQTDDKFLELAVNGRADLILTGDADLLVLGAFRDIPIIAPVTFLRAYYPDTVS